MELHTNNATPSDPSLSELITGFFDETLSPEAQQELDERLQSDAEARRLYLRHAEIEAYLRRHGYGDLHDVLGESGHVVEALGREIVPPKEYSEKPTAPVPQVWRKSLLDLAARRPMKPSLVVAAVVLVMGLALMSQVEFSTVATSDKPSTEQANNTEPVARLLHEAAAKWKIEHVKNPVTKRKQQIKPSLNLYAGQKLVLSSGLAELRFNNGAEVVLEGPAEFEIDGEKGCSIDFGKMVGRCPTQQSKGFVVVTPTAQVTDLGTEFAVAVVRGGRSEIHVVRGKVAVRAAIAPGTYGDAVEIGANRAAAVDSDQRIASIAYSPHQRVLIPQLDRDAIRDISIANASFEFPALKPNTRFQSAVTDWKAIWPNNYGVSTFGREFAEPVPDGAQMLFLNAGAVSQELLETLAPNTKYTLSLSVGNRPGKLSPDYTVELYAGTTLLVSNHNETLPADGRFGEVRLQFSCDDTHAAIGERLSIVLKSNGSLATKTQNHFDAVRLQAEPMPTATEETSQAM